LDELKKAIESISALLASGAESELFVPFVRTIAASHEKVVAPVFDPGVRLYRATRHHLDLPAAKEDLWYPPADRARAGRANYAGQSIFYSSVQKSPALSEIEAGPYSIVVISEWVTQDRMIVQDLGFEERAFHRFGIDRPRADYQLEDVKNASEAALEARRFISDAFLRESRVDYALTAAIANVFTESNHIVGIRYPSLAINGRADNFALRPDYVRTNMRLEAATYFRVGTVSGHDYSFDPIADLTGIDEKGNLSWTYRDHISHLPPQAGLAVNLPPGDKIPLIIRSPMEIAFENRRYAVVPGCYLERTLDGPVVKLPDGTIVEGIELSDPISVTTHGKSPATLAYEANIRFEEFQTVMAIAVRSRDLLGKRVSLAATVTLSAFDFEAKPWTCQQSKQAAFEFHDARALPEFVAWWKLIHTAQGSSLPHPTLVIVEGGVQTVAAINARIQPLLGGEFLPDGFTLACSRVADGPTDFVASKALSECVKDAAELLDWLTAHPDCPAQTFEDSEYYSRMRVWIRKATAD
jgi:RES domain-containing protein